MTGRSVYDQAIRALYDKRARLLDSPSKDEQERLLPGLEYALDVLELREKAANEAPVALDRGEAVAGELAAAIREVEVQCDDMSDAVALVAAAARNWAALQWREPSVLGNGDFAVFRMPIVVNGKPDVDIWVSRLRERESEDEFGNVTGCWDELEDCGYEWEVVKAEALCISLDALPALPSEPVKP